MTLPGVSVVTAIALMAAIGDIKRFPTPTRDSSPIWAWTPGFASRAASPPGMAGSPGRAPARSAACSLTRPGAQLGRRARCSSHATSGTRSRTPAIGRAGSSRSSFPAGSSTVSMRWRRRWASPDLDPQQMAEGAARFGLRCSPRAFRGCPPSTGSPTPCSRPIISARAIEHRRAWLAARFCVAILAVAATGLRRRWEPAPARRRLSARCAGHGTGFAQEQTFGRRCRWRSAPPCSGPA